MLVKEHIIGKARANSVEPPYFSVTDPRWGAQADPIEVRFAIMMREKQTPSSSSTVVLYYKSCGGQVLEIMELKRSSDSVHLLENNRKTSPEKATIKGN